MAIQFNCRNCAKQLRVADQNAGKRCKCPGCDEIVDIPLPATENVEESYEIELCITCPKCKHELRCKPNLVGTKGQCRKCKHVFTINDQQTDDATLESKEPALVFNCPQCNQLFDGKPNMDGKPGKCHVCGKVFKIRLKPTKATGNTEATSRKKSKPTSLQQKSTESNREEESYVDLSTPDLFAGLDSVAPKDPFASSDPFAVAQQELFASSTYPPQPVSQATAQRTVPNQAMRGSSTPSSSRVTDADRTKKLAILLIVGAMSTGTLLLVGCVFAVVFFMPKRDGAVPVAATSSEPPAKILKRPRDTAEVREAFMKLKQIQYAFLNFESANKMLAYGNGAPSADSRVSQLSWRVHLLPYLDQVGLYSQFKLDEPWDSPSNRPLADRMPDIYRIGNVPGNNTRFQVVQGKDMPFGDKQCKLANITDGMENTVLALTVGTDKAVPWTCPTDFQYDPSEPVQSLGTLPGGVFIAVSMSKGPFVFGDNVDPSKLAAVFSARLGEIEYLENLQQESMAADGWSGEDILAFLDTINGAPAKSDVANKQSPPPTGAKTVASKGDYKPTLQAIAAAFQAHENQFGGLPQPQSQDVPGGKLSWRVHILPYLGHIELYRKFHLDEPWDSPSNKPLLNQMPPEYKTGATSTTSLRAFYGKNMLLGNPLVRGLMDVSDSVVGTLVAIKVSESMAVPWTQPDDLPGTPENIRQIISELNGAKLQCAFTDATAMDLPTDALTQHLQAMATATGGEIFDMEKIKTMAGPLPQPNPQAFSKIMAFAKQDSARCNAAKELVNGMLNYQSTYKRYPIANNEKFFDQNGKPYLSWRVHILPFIDQVALYKQFKLDEPWDSPDNAKLIDKMPPVYRDRRDTVTAFKTRVHILTGPGTVFRDKFGPTPKDYPDGLQTIALVISGADNAVTWTQPENLQYDPQNPLACLGAIDGNSVVVGRLDGACFSIKSSIPKALFSGFVSPDGKEIAPAWAFHFGWR